MKTKIKRHSREVLAVLLSVCMLVSCFTVGVIATDAAKPAQENAAISDSADNGDTAGADADANAVDSAADSKSADEAVGAEDMAVNSKDDGEEIGAKDDSESVGGNWNAEGKNNLKISFDNMTTWQVFKSNSDGYINFTVPNNCTAYWEYWADYGGTSRKYLQKSGDSAPDSSSLGSGDDFWARAQASYSSGTEFTANLTAGQYVIQYDGFATYGSDNFGSLKYHWWRKVVKARGNITGNWDTYTELTYDNTASAYYIDYIPSSDGNKFFRFQLKDGGNYFEKGPNNNNNAGNIDISSYSSSNNKYTLGNNTSDAVYINMTSGHTYRIWLSTSDWSTFKTWYSDETVVTDEYYVAGQYSDGSPQFFGTAWSPNLSDNKMTYNSAIGKYSITYTSNVTGGTIQFKIVKSGDWNQGSYPSANKTQVIYSTSTQVTITFDPDTKEITVTQNGSEGSGTSGSWTAGDKYTSSGTANSSQKVSNTPNIGTTSTTYRFVWANNDNGPGTAGTTAIVPIANASSGNIGYWADITTQAKNNSNFYFALSNNSSNAGIRGNKQEQINCVTKSNNDTVTMYTSTGDTAFKAQIKERSSISNSAYYILVFDADWEKIDNIGVMAYYNDSNVDYQFYFKEIGTTPVEETKVVDIYAKNGTLRDSTFNRFTNLADTDILDYFYYEETNPSTGAVTTYNSISDYNNDHSTKQIVLTHEIAYGNSTYDKMTNVPVGAKIKICTELSPNSEIFAGTTKFSDSHYLKAYSFNGMTYKVFSPSDGVATTNGKKYTEEWTVRAVNTQYKNSSNVFVNATKDGTAVEVTPIYYMQSSYSTNVKTFYIDGYDGEVQNSWGNMLAVYPYYEGKSNKDNAFGGYPGQPMLFWGGKYQMEIPLTVDGTASGASVKGLTLHNGYWDLLHRSLDIRCNDRNHAQTYDYDDFYKLYKEKNPDTIIFDFKYRTTHDNYGDGYDYTNYTFAGSSAKAASTYAGSGYNGVELVTDYFGRQVDLFGNLIKDDNLSDYDSTHTQDKELLIVSTGYKDTYVGEYATIWAVYAPQTERKHSESAGQFIGYISSSMLYLNNIDRRLQYTSGDSTDNGRMSWGDSTDKGFKYTYEYLKSYYTGVPALISYEKEIWNDSKDKANRSDGKWYYSNKSDKVTASIKIQYGSYTLMNAPDHSVSSDAWRDDPFDVTTASPAHTGQTGVGGEENIGTTTGCSAYFTNTSPNLLGKTNSGEQFADSSKNFTFQAVASGSYMFASWVRYSNGKYYEITEEEIGQSPMSANDVYIARFVDAQTGTLTIQHVVEQTNTFNGTGTPRLQVTVKNGETTVSGGSFDVNDGSKVDISKWIDSHFKTYTIDITLSTDPDDTSESFMKEIVSSSGNFAFDGDSTWNPDKTPTSSSGADTGTKTVTIAQFTVQDVLNSGVTNLRYVSHLMKPIYTYKYEITYTYTSRFWGTQSYLQTGTFANDSEFAANTTGAKTTAKLTTDFIIHQTPYEKNFRQQINWNYTNAAVTTGDNTAAAMVNNAATDSGQPANTYLMTAHVYSSNTVNDRVTAEFVLPYNNRGADYGYQIYQADLYDSASDPHVEGAGYEYETRAKDNLYDTSHESVTLTTQAYKLFTYDGSSVTGSDSQEASQTPLIEAAPYVITNPTYHYMPTDSKRYYTGNSFTANGKTYYLRKRPDGSTDDRTNDIVITDDEVRAGQFCVTFTKRKYNSTLVTGGDNHTTTYKYAVEEGTPGELGYKIYFFAYNMNSSEQMTNNEGVVITDAEFKNGTDPVFNGQYICYTETQEIDGFVKNTGTKKYFTRWDIYNTRGEFVASSYNRRFNYSGYDNYVVRPIYESNSENQYASSTPTGYTSKITYLDDSRNQWKGNSASGQYHNITGQTDLYAADKIFADFAITYAYEGRDINTIDSSEAKIRTGIVIERLDQLDSAGGKKITEASYYADKYKGDTNWQNLAGRLAGTTSGTLTSAVTSGHMCYKSRIGTNYANYTSTGTASDKGYTLFGNEAPGHVSGQSSVVDNFNRLQWFYTFNNTTQAESDSAVNATKMKDYAYRAISYMIVETNGATNAYLTDSPTYFTIYDTASRAHN